MLNASTKTNADHLANFKSTLTTLALNCNTWSAELSAGAVRFDKIVQIAKCLRDRREYFTTYLTPATVIYVNSEMGQDISPDMSRIYNAINAIITEIRSLIPVTADNYVKERKFVAGGDIVTDTLSIVQTAGIRANLMAISTLVG